MARNARSWSELENFPRLSPAQRKEDLGRRLLAQVKYFGQREDALPEWREAAKINNPSELWTLWPSLPVLGKAHMRSRFDVDSMAKRFGLIGTASSTGGSTGEPVPYFHDTAMHQAAMAATVYTQLRMGWQPGMPLVILWGSEKDIRREVSWKNKLYGELRNELLIDAYRMSDETVDRTLLLCQRYGPVAIYGFTSILEYVARRTLERGLVPPSGLVQVAWNGGEMLFPEQDALFKQAFGTGILNRYGGRELSAMACQFSPGAALEVLRPWLMVEVLDEKDKPVAPGESGRLIWTSTICRGTPFLRYDVGDLGSFAAEHCDDAGISALVRLEGRTAGLLTLPNGRQINNLYWNHFFKDISEVRQFQVELRKNGDLLIRLVGSGFSAEREAHVRSLFQHFLGAVPVKLTWVPEIPRSPQGKLVQVIREK